MYGADDAGGFGPALQMVTDYSPMLMDSVTVLLHRLGVAYTAIMNPGVPGASGPGGRIRRHAARRRPGGSRDGIDETWIHVPLSPSADSRSGGRGRRACCRSVLADARQVAVDSAALNATLVGLAERARCGPHRALPRL